MAKDHFSPEKGLENETRYVIYQLMDYFEKMDSTITKLLSFEMAETKALDQIEENLIQMEKLHLRLHQLVKQIEKEQTIGEEIVYQSSTFHEAIRRTYNLLTALNVIDLNSDNWVSRTTRALVDRVYYRQIKALVYKSLPKDPEEM